MHNNQSNEKKINPVFQRYIKSDMVNTHLLIVVLSVFIYIVFKFTEKDIYSALSMSLMIFAVISFFIHLNLRRLHIFIGVNKRTSNAPYERIKRINGLFLTIFVMTITAFIYITPKLQFKYILSVLGAFIKSIISKILAFIFRNVNKAKPNRVLQPDINTSKVNLVPKAESQWTTFLKVFESVMNIIAIMGIIVLLGYLLVYLFKKFYIKKSKDEDISVFLSPTSTIKKLKKDNNQVKEGFISKLLNTNLKTRIRNKYKNTLKPLLKNKGLLTKDSKFVILKGVKKIDTLSPTELEKITNLESNAENTYLHNLYIKARYSNEEITKEEYDKLKGKIPDECKERITFNI